MEMLAWCARADIAQKGHPWPFHREKKPRWSNSEVAVIRGLIDSVRYHTPRAATAGHAAWLYTVTYQGRSDRINSQSSLSPSLAHVIFA